MAGSLRGERARIVTALAGAAHTVAHIGSTSVPTLAAKDVVDILVTVADPDDETRYLGPMERAGYILRVREPGHRMVRNPKAMSMSTSGRRPRRTNHGICSFATGCAVTTPTGPATSDPSGTWPPGTGRT